MWLRMALGLGCALLLCLFGATQGAGDGAVWGGGDAPAWRSSALRSERPRSRSNSLWQFSSGRYRKLTMLDLALQFAKMLAIWK